MGLMSFVMHSYQLVVFILVIILCMYYVCTFIKINQILLKVNCLRKLKNAKTKIMKITVNIIPQKFLEPK